MAALAKISQSCQAIPAYLGEALVENFLGTIVKMYGHSGQNIPKLPGHPCLSGRSLGKKDFQKYYNYFLAKEDNDYDNCHDIDDRSDDEVKDDHQEFKEMDLVYPYMEEWRRMRICRAG